MDSLGEGVFAGASRPVEGHAEVDVPCGTRQRGTAGPDARPRHQPLVDAPLQVEDRAADVTPDPM
jgi:hypothetical protein